MVAQKKITFKELKTKSTLIYIDTAWAKNSVNAVSFRKNALVTYKDTQFVSFYDPSGFVVLGKRALGTTNWILRKTNFRGNVKDAHNTISIMVDGNGYLHLAWDHHNNKLHYTKSILPGSLEMLPPMPMTGLAENSVSYPEFYAMPKGDILFLFRDGRSGKGNLVMNRYDVQTGKWKNLHLNLIDGEGLRNAYWQCCVDNNGGIHLSWVWRESPDVSSNHDLAYARSLDGGMTWQKSNGASYTLPINAAAAEYAARIPMQSELINQTSMQADANGYPYIASYWKDSMSAVPQYHIISLSKEGWQVKALNFRKTDFSLQGMGTKAIPIARPQILVQSVNAQTQVMLLFRDIERNDRPSIAMSLDAQWNHWGLSDLSKISLGGWEPCYDFSLWNREKKLHIFAQPVFQSDGEGVSQIAPQKVYVLEWMRK